MLVNPKGGLAAGQLHLPQASASQGCGGSVRRGVLAPPGIMFELGTYPALRAFLGPTLPCWPPNSGSLHSLGRGHLGLQTPKSHSKEGVSSPRGQVQEG